MSMSRLDLLRSQRWFRASRMDTFDGGDAIRTTLFTWFLVLLLLIELAVLEFGIRRTLVNVNTL